MRGMNYTRATNSAKPEGPSSSLVREALETHAASRPPKSPPKAMPVTPTLPRVKKRKKRP